MADDDLLVYEATIIHAESKFGGKTPPGPPLQPPGGGDEMEARVRVLETHVDHIRNGVAKIESAVDGLRSDSSSIKVNVATLTERVAHLPGKGFIVTAATGVVAAVIMLLTLLSRLGLLAAGH